ncbi:MAG TPA: biotin carboxylase N-terminal domain-containing protein [Capillimicrobium sp.]|nr:biotin carboxylase N-terminal domain-containing protein [Capillimicrobium sp.]
MHSPVLVANRGEIARRVLRTLRALGLESIAVYVDDDAAAPHVEEADLAVRVASYLDPEALVAAARATGAAAVHPGYGFLSENAAFARAVLDAGIDWVGPPPEAIELMGDKARAKRLAREAGVPVVPGIEGDDVGLGEARAFCEEHGFPAVIKAVAGGGGKGMRVVRAMPELEPALEAARREAIAAFGDGRVLVERYLERPRHIEIQVLADRHGSVVHLGERECSLQRRHQKVVEEAPSPVVDAALRERMGAAAVALARACGYEGAGTVEFIAAGDGSSFAFLEMNTRLQVEHPVTELVYGVDLVELQLRVAAGEPLGLEQAALVPRGHAVEARLYAEDPANGFLPAGGTIRAYREPSGPGVRVDSGVRAGTEVGTAFDPMLAKVIAHGPDRATALRRLDRALAELVVLGVPTNAAFTRTLLARDDVRAGDQDTGLLERVLAETVPPAPGDLLAAAGVARFLRDTAGLTAEPGPWRWAVDGHGEVRVEPGRVMAGDRAWAWEARFLDGETVWVSLDGLARRYAVAFDAGAGTTWIARDGHQLELRTHRRGPGGADVRTGSLEAPMPGKVLLVPVANGDAVDEGDVLVVLESMKMELSITAPVAGTVAGLDLSPGDRVARGQALVTVEP